MRGKVRLDTVPLEIAGPLHIRRFIVGDITGWFALIFVTTVSQQFWSLIIAITAISTDRNVERDGNLEKTSRLDDDGRSKFAKCAFATSQGWHRADSGCWASYHISLPPKQHTSADCNQRGVEQYVPAPIRKTARDDVGGLRWLWEKFLIVAYFWNTSPDEYYSTKKLFLGNRMLFTMKIKTRRVRSVNS